MEHKGKALAPPAVEIISDEFCIDVEFENAWETTSDWNEDDDEAAQEENALCFPDDHSAKMIGKGDNSDKEMEVW